MNSGASSAPPRPRKIDLRRGSGWAGGYPICGKPQKLGLRKSLGPDQEKAISAFSSQLPLGGNRMVRHGGNLISAEARNAVESLAFDSSSSGLDPANLGPIQ